jgi:hypothetical protein
MDLFAEKLQQNHIPQYNKINDLMVPKGNSNLLQKMLSSNDQFERSQHSENPHPEPPKIRLQDLCPEDKVKVGELVKKLAEEKRLREE